MAVHAGVPWSGDSELCLHIGKGQRGVVGGLDMRRVEAFVHQELGQLLHLYCIIPVHFFYVVHSDIPFL